MRRKIIAIILCAAFIFLLNGCGNNDGGNYVATVKIGYYEAGYGTEFMDFWTTEYNKAHPDEMINFEIDPNVSASSIGMSLENSAGLNDIYCSLATNWYGWVKSGWVEPLNDLGDMINSDGVKFDDAFVSDVFKNYGYIDNNRYVISMSGGKMGNGFIYSEKLFRQHNWEVPATVDELYALVETINNDPVNKDNDPNNDIAPFGWGGQVLAYWNSVINLWWAQYEGPEYMENFYKNPSPELYQNRPGLKKAIEVFENLICTGEGVPKNSLPGAMGKNHLLMQKDFVQYKCAMIPGMYGIINETKSYIDPDCDLKMFLPAIEDAKTDEDGNPLIISASDQGNFDFMFIAKASNVKDYAKKFLVWISSKDMASGFIKYTNGGSPFAYNLEKLDGVSTLIKSALEIGSGSNFRLIDTSSSNPLVALGKITTWPAGEPYTDMILNNKSASTTIKNQYTYVLSNWAEWERIAGVN